MTTRWAKFREKVKLNLNTKRKGNRFSIELNAIPYFPVVCANILQVPRRVKSLKEQKRTDKRPHHPLDSSEIKTAS